MALRSNWEGFLRFNLLSVPVKAYSAIAPGHGKIAFHQMHAKCKSRIRYKKVCPVHGEVTKEEIVPGYEYAKDEYVVIDPKDIAKLRAHGEKSIDIDVFIRPDALDPLYYSDRTYYLAPDGRVGEKPYSVLRDVMASEERHAIATMIFSGREQVVAVRPMGRLLAITLLNYEETVKKPEAFESEAPEVKVSAKELGLARSLIDASTVDELDFSKYRDEYNDQIAKLVEAKVEGKEITTAPKGEEPAIINLMDALRKSLDLAKRGKSGQAHESFRIHLSDVGGLRYLLHLECLLPGTRDP